MDSRWCSRTGISGGIFNGIRSVVDVKRVWGGCGVHLSCMRFVMREGGGL
jgi:hypothetical protein